jgi:hypothetical protein
MENTIIQLAKGMANMDEINSYIDVCLIDEYAEKDFENGYSLDVDSLPENERANFLDRLMQEDTTVRDLVLYHMQKLIDERLPEREAEDRQHAGLKLIRLSNGDTQLVRASW